MPLKYQQTLSTDNDVSHVTVHYDSNVHRLQLLKVQKCEIYSFFNSVSLPFQDYFSSYETGQSEGGAKTGEP